MTTKNKFSAEIEFNKQTLVENEWIEETSTEVEELLRSHPEAAEKFIQKFLKKQLNFAELSATERGILLQASLELQASHEGFSPAIKALKELDFIRTPPTPEEFLNDPQYLGPIQATIYPYWKERLLYILEPKNKIYELVLTGGIGIGKTRIAIIAQLYKLAWLSCLRNIPTYFGLDQATKICFGLFTLSLTKAETALSADFKKIISLSPFFRNIFPLKKSNSVRRVLNTTGDSMENFEVMLPQGLYLLMGSKLQHALSLAIISGIIDEMNFRAKRTIKAEDDEDSAVALYSEMSSRIKSRFNKLGHVPGVLCVISSKKAQADFLESHINSKRNDPHVFIAGGSQWDVKPWDYSKEKFYVFMGSSRLSSRILEPEEYKLYPPDSPNILDVPTDLRPDFEYDINAALRNLAGVATSGSNLLFEDPLIISTSWDKERHSPFESDVILNGTRTRKELYEYINYEDLVKDVGFSVIPKNHASMNRVISIDLSKKNDMTGICMGGVSAIREYITKDLEGNPTVTRLTPEMWIDFVIGIKAPQGDQVDYEKVQNLVMWLKQHRFKIRVVTFDQWNSIGPMQMLGKSGIDTEDVSVVKTDAPYLMLRDAILNKYLSLYKIPYLEKEMCHLQHILTSRNSRVDHPANFTDGSYATKDMSDALASNVWMSMEMLTNYKRFPDTANIEVSKNIVRNLFPAMQVEGKVSRDTYVYSDNEFENLDRQLGIGKYAR